MTFENFKAALFSNPFFYFSKFSASIMIIVEFCSVCGKTQYYGRELGTSIRSLRSNHKKTSRRLKASPGVPSLQSAKIEANF